MTCFYFAKNIEGEKTTSFVEVDDRYNYFDFFETAIFDSIENGSTIKLYAVWKANTYKFVFNDNTNKGSTTPYFANVGGQYNLTTAPFEIYIEFDTDDYNIVGTLPTVKMIDRLGYTWRGWFYDNKAFKIDNEVDFNAKLFASSNNQYAVFNANEMFNYDFFINFITKTDTKFNDTFVYSDSAEDIIADIDIKEYGAITLYAGWQANEYDVYYDYGSDNFEPNVSHLEGLNKISESTNSFYFFCGRFSKSFSFNC